MATSQSDSATVTPEHTILQLAATDVWLAAPMGFLQTPDLVLSSEGGSGSCASAAFVSGD